jgi:hypothetical protein
MQERGKLLWARDERRMATGQKERLDTQLPRRRSA